VVISTSAEAIELIQAMKKAQSIPNEEAIVVELRANPQFATEYLKAALEDVEEPIVLTIALRHLAIAWMLRS